MPSAINPFDDDKFADWQQWGRKASYENTCATADDSLPTRP